MNTQLLRELQDYAKNQHAQSVFRKCLQNGKIATAMMIAIKYDIHTIEERCDDVQMSLGLAIIAGHNFNQKK